MIARTLSAANKGINSYVVSVEADVISGLPQFDIVGLPDAAVKESKERVRAAIRNSGINIGSQKITVNLAPADFKKIGTAFDLPIAVSILMANNSIPNIALNDYIFAGELSLNGDINGINGILPIVCETRSLNIANCIIPYENKEEVSSLDNVNIFPAKNLSEVINHLSNKKRITRLKVKSKKEPSISGISSALDFKDVEGQQLAKRAFAVAAAGQHNILLIGPPGVGKTMMAQRLPSIMPPLTFDESLEVTKIFSVRGLIPDKVGLIRERPFRVTHNTISRVAMIGGGNPPMPGEISLAHDGVLFLDEIAEYPKGLLESLRQPLEDRKIVVSRTGHTYEFPANFMLVAASNPCPCGYLGVPDKCRCKASEIANYMKRISGPLLDRIDLRIEVQAVAFHELNSKTGNISSRDLREQVGRALEMQKARFQNMEINFNGQMDAASVKKFCTLGESESSLLENAFKSFSISTRAYHKILKVARTIADFDKSENIGINHLAEALQFRL